MKVSKINIPLSWKRSIDRICLERPKKVLVMGESDRGKSTYCKLLMRHLCEEGVPVAFVDGDIGQTDLGPPASIALGYLKGRATLSQARWKDLYFVGDITPIGHFLPMVVGMKKLVDSVQADVVVMNTTGFVTKSGVVLNSFLIESLQPDLIIALEKNKELEPIIRPHRHLDWVNLPPSRQARKKSPLARKLARERAFRNYFRNATTKTLDIRKIIFQRKFPTTLSSPLEKHWLCGVSDQNDNGIGLAIVKQFNAENGKLSVYTPLPKEAIQTLQFGDLWVMPNGQHGPFTPRVLG